MASFTKLESGKWRAFVYRGGVRRTKSFATKALARQWAAREEYVLDNPVEVNSRIMFGDLLDRYAREVSSAKRGGRTEIIRIERLRREPIARIALGDLTTQDFASWRDRRLREVKSASVRRELEQWSAVLSKARREWGLMSNNPLEGMTWPRDSPPRDRLATTAEIDALRLSAGDDLSRATARAFHAWLFAIETGLRAGEIASMLPEHVYIERRFIHLPITKNGTARDVPMSSEAVRLVEALPKFATVFGLSSSQISSLFRKIRDRADVVNLTFHDSRHMAVTRLARVYDVLELARVIGHRDIRMLQRYYNATAEELAKRLD